MHTALQARIRIVQSPANRWVKALRAALTHPAPLARAPYAAGEAPLLALEGFHLVQEALRSGMAPAALFLRAGDEDNALAMLTGALQNDNAGADDLQASLKTTEVLALPPGLFASLHETESPQPITALVPAPSRLPEALFAAQTVKPLLLVLAALQDPGNVGTLLRSAEAFGATGAMLLTGTATPWSTKCLRASAGSALRVPLLAVRSAADAAALLRAHGVRSLAAVPSGGTAVEAAALHEASALWIGNEGAGLRQSDLDACDARVSLSMTGPTESLNAAVAGSLLMYEASRQREASRSGKHPKLI